MTRIDLRQVFRSRTPASTHRPKRVALDKQMVDGVKQAGQDEIDGDDGQKAPESQSAA